MHSLIVFAAIVFAVIYHLKLDHAFVSKTNISYLGVKPLSNSVLLILLILIVSNNPIYGLLSLVTILLMLLSMLVFFRLERADLTRLLIGSLLLLPLLYFIKLGGLGVDLSSAVLAVFVIFLIRELYVQPS